MSDQAQGLRALADQVRGEHNDIECPLFGSPVSPARASAGSASQPAGPPAFSGVAAVDGRLHRAPAKPVSTPKRQARVLAVTSGKGGVGKSNFSTNLAISFGQRGKRVIIMDADMGQANAHILLGTSPPFSLDHVMRGTKSLAQVMHNAAANVQLVAGGSGIAELGRLTAPLRFSFLAGLRALDSACDLIVIDTGAGIARNVLAFLYAVNEVIVLTTPEPTAIADAYATIKVVSRENPGARILLVVNMVHSSGEGAVVAGRLSAITRQFLDLDIEYAGCIPIDPAVPNAVRLRTPFASSAPDCPAAAGINQIIRRLGNNQAANMPESGMTGFASRMQRYLGITAVV